METSTTNFGPLTCRVVTGMKPDQPAKLVIVLCHGYGAPGDDLVPIAQEILRWQPELAASTVWIFPAAPLLLDGMNGYESRAWWPIDMERMLMAVEAGKLDRLRQEDPPRLSEARTELTAAIEEITAKYGIGHEQLIVGGFSQGAMLATETAMHLSPAPAALAIFSGTLIREEQWRQLFTDAEPLRILQSHGTTDPVLPYAGAESLRDLLTASGHEVDFMKFDGMHTISVEAIRRLVELIGALLAGP